MTSRTTRPLPVGKLPLEQLRTLLARLPARDSRLLIGPQIGEDAAVIDMGGRSLVVATDPVTFATEHIGRYAVHVNANDVAVLGARPSWFFAVLLLPEEGTTEGLLEEIVEDLRGACEELGVTLCGGHTEVTQGLDRPIVVGQMLGEVPSSRLVRKSGLRVGDRVLLTEGVAIEGTAILARERRQRLETLVGSGALDRAASFLVDPGISVVRAALAAADTGLVHAMHDTTEGGLVTALVEFVAPAGLGARIVRSRVPVLPETTAVCAALGLDPLKLIASGALLIGVSPADVDTVRAALAAMRIPVADIGEVMPATAGLTMVTEDGSVPLAAADRDELARAFEE